MDQSPWKGTQLALAMSMATSGARRLLEFGSISHCILPRDLSGTLDSAVLRKRTGDFIPEGSLYRPTLGSGTNSSGKAGILTVASKDHYLWYRLIKPSEWTSVSNPVVGSADILLHITPLHPHCADQVTLVL